MAKCKRVPVKKGSKKKKTMCWNSKGKLISAARAKAARKHKKK